MRRRGGRLGRGLGPGRGVVRRSGDGEKGEGKWKEIEWDEALDLLANKLQEAIDKDGNQSIVFDGHAVRLH